MRVLVVEDETSLANLVADGLRSAGMAVDVAPDGVTALAKADVNDYDVVILDRGLPGITGDDVCRRISGRSAAVLMLTARGTEQDEVDGFALGADDYLAKPFSFPVLTARVRALARRHVEGAAPVLERGGIRLDRASFQAWRDGRLLPLARKELGVLEQLLLADGAVVSAEQLLERVWDEHIDPFTNVVRMTVLRLRRKLGEPPVIGTVPGVGYRL